VFNKVSFENRAVYEIMWENFVEPGRLQMIIWRLQLACWVPKATNIYSEYAILIAFKWQKWLHETASMLLISTLSVTYKRVFKLCFI
jgi:hypothetical protein